MTVLESVVRDLDPKPGGEVFLFGARHVFQAAPFNDRMLDEFEGQRAKTYRVRDERGRDHALKVFWKSFREPSVIDACRRLEPLGSLPGFRAAERRVVLPGEPAARMYVDLCYAVRMPWIHGRNWGEVLVPGENKEPLPRATAIYLCQRLLGSLRELESRGCAHTDIASGNVVITPEGSDIELIDLEDLYFPGQPAATYQNCGSPGYAHPSRVSHSCAEGDRYAAAIIAAEMLLLTDAVFAAQGGDSGLFGEDHLSSSSAALFREAEAWLAVSAPDLLGPFRRARASASLADCPRIAELYAALEALAAPIPRSKRIWIELDAMPSPRIQIVPPVFVASPRIIIEPDPPAAEMSDAPSAPSRGAGFWLCVALLIFLMIWFLSQMN